MAWHICFYILCSTGYDGYDCHKIEVTQLLCAAQSVSKAGEFTIPVENPTISKNWVVGIHRKEYTKSVEIDRYTCP